MRAGTTAATPSSGRTGSDRSPRQIITHVALTNHRSATNLRPRAPPVLWLRWAHKQTVGAHG